MNDDPNASWSELQTLRDQLREAFAAKQHANADARLAPPVCNPQRDEGKTRDPSAQDRGRAAADRVR
jgi:hypothetical protein